MDNSVGITLYTKFLLDVFLLLLNSSIFDEKRSQTYGKDHEQDW